MPHIFIKKENKKRSYRYCNKENLKLAVEEVKQKKLNLRKAVENFDL